MLYKCMHGPENWGRSTALNSYIRQRICSICGEIWVLDWLSPIPQRWVRSLYQERQEMKIVPEIPTKAMYQGEIFGFKGLLLGSISIGPQGTYLFYPNDSITPVIVGIKELEFIIEKLREANRLLS
jgi:hypothetical protein